MTAMPPLIRTDRVRKTFNGRGAVDCVSISWNSSSIVGLIGPNGAGKSTLLDLICGRARADSGKVWIAEQETSGWAMPRVSRLGVVRLFQGGGVVRGLTVFENALMAAERPRGPELICHLLTDHGRDNEESARRALDACGLLHLHSRLAGELSQGQTKILGLAMCVARGARIMLLDEPFAGVERARFPVLASILQDKRDSGGLVVIVEHDLEALEKVADHIVTMVAGRIAENAGSRSSALPDE